MVCPATEYTAYEPDGFSRLVYLWFCQTGIGSNTACHAERQTCAVNQGDGEYHLQPHNGSVTIVASQITVIGRTIDIVWAVPSVSPAAALARSRQARSYR